jgi:LuxR family transcriptional regulator, maltose regulon positive regulatory protein
MTSVNATAQAAESVGPALVATKLHVPEVRPGLVPRRELLDRLIAAEDRKLTLVCAPAGWGKTVLLGEWHARPEETRPFAWVSLDPGDDDPVRFWGYVIAALRTLEPELGGSALRALPAAGPGLVDAVVAPLLNELVELPTRLVLVLDDYHLVHEGPIHASVGFLLRHLPHNVHLAIATRAMPPLPLGGLRASGEMLEVRAAELAFSELEAEALLNGSLGLGLDRGDVELLQARTEGWAAGLQLAALSLRAQDDRHTFVESFSGDDRHVGDYLHELLQELPPTLRDFLLHTSILERMCVALCDALTGRGDASERLAEADRASLFLVSLDNRRDWYRYHHLFRDLLRRELDRSAPHLVADLHRRAHAWHAEHGLVDEAIAHATAAGDLGEACELIARHWLPLFNMGQTETLARWIDALPREAVLADARVCLVRGWVALFLGRYEEVDAWLDAGERGSAASRPANDGLGTVEANAALLEASLATLSGDVGTAMEAARRALAEYEDAAAPGRAIANLNLAQALYYTDALTKAEAAFDEVLRWLSGAEWAAAIVTALGDLGAIHCAAGRSERAERRVAEAETVLDDCRAHRAPFAAPALLARGKLLELRGDLAAAEVALEHAVTVARGGDWRLPLADGLLALALVKRRRRAHDEGRVLVREAREVIALCRDPGTLADRLARTERTLQLAPDRRSASAAPADPRLSERELAVLRLLGSELSQREIGSELYVSLNTVKAHVRSIFRKLGVATRADAVERGRALDLL